LFCDEIWRLSSNQVNAQQLNQQTKDKNNASPNFKIHTYPLTNQIHRKPQQTMYIHLGESVSSNRSEKKFPIQQSLETPPSFCLTSSPRINHTSHTFILYFKFTPSCFLKTKKILHKQPHAFSSLSTHTHTH